MNKRKPVIVQLEKQFKKQPYIYPSLTACCKAMEMSRTKLMRMIDLGEPIKVDGCQAFVDLAM